ncbi:MAG: phosphatidylglycerol lysyltransferase domain-containing protein [Helicobacteraceae bacterium]|jgi:hypothetical protein|nr:phosphatidylglycerol lysyltransferase domain-containing protein [Helicobacteraceae bacterium]
MEFSPISLEWQAVLDGALAEQAPDTADAVFVNLWLWRFERKIELAKDRDFIYIKQTCHTCDGEEQEPYFLFPVGRGNIKAALERLAKHCAAEGTPLRFRALTTKQKAALEGCCPRGFDIKHDRDHSDYLYDCAALINLNGRDYHSKKNFINRFATFYGIRYERLNDTNYYETIAFINAWFERAPYPAEAEKKGIISLLNDYRRFRCSYGLLRAEGQIAAFTIGESLSENAAVIHVEKADGANFQGSYQTINQVHLAREYADKTIINREEDLGIEGLRKAKLSYHPIAFADKFSAIAR